MSELVFTHPNPRVRGSLSVPVKPDKMIWSYGLNTANYPTYGGEVVQILSCYINDMSIKGTVYNYEMLETIYAWFINYIQIATTGAKGGGSFDTRPVTVMYPERGWTFKIYPKGLPAFKYGRDVVAPEWSMMAAIVEPDQSLTNNILTDAQTKAIRGELGGLFGVVTGGIGFEAADPFSSPDGFQAATDQVKKNKSTPRNEYGDLADWYNQLIPSYLGGDFKDLSAEYSRPAFLGGAPSQSQTDATKDAKDDADDAAGR